MKTFLYSAYSIMKKKMIAIHTELIISVHNM